MSFYKYCLSLLILITFFVSSCSSNTKLNDVEPFEELTNKEIKGINASEIKFQKINDENIAFNNGVEYTGVALNYFDNGNKYYSTTYKNGIKEGEWRIWHPNGKVQKIGNSLNGKEQGIYQEFYPSGQLKYEYFYENGKKVEQWRSWYNNGGKWTSRDFENNILNGKVLVWDSLGTLTKEYTYRNGDMIDKQLYFDEGK